MVLYVSAPVLAAPAGYVSFSESLIVSGRFPNQLVSRARRFLWTESVVCRCGSDPQPDSLSNCVTCGRGSDHAVIFLLISVGLFCFRAEGGGGIPSETRNTQ